jgi:hypothetical protein
MCFCICIKKCTPHNTCNNNQIFHNYSPFLSAISLAFISAFIFEWEQKVPFAKMKADMKAREIAERKGE